MLLHGCSRANVFCNAKIIKINELKEAGYKLPVKSCANKIKLKEQKTDENRTTNKISYKERTKHEYKFFICLKGI
jgi:hypothetical protein